jgi:hypothetical protein
MGLRSESDLSIGVIHALNFDSTLAPGGYGAVAALLQPGNILLQS